MNTEFTIKNFRIFDSEGATFTIAPLTLLTGCNSAGKSSMVKAMLLLKNFFDQMHRDIDLYADCYPTRYQLGVTNPNLKLGDFSSILNKDSKDNKITFAYTIKPLIAAEIFTVEYVFACDDNDTLNEGWLHSIVVKNENMDIVFHIQVENHKINVVNKNIGLLKKSFSQYAAFMMAQHMEKASKIVSYEMVDGVMTNVNKDKSNKLQSNCKYFIDVVSPDNKDDFKEYITNDCTNERTLFSLLDADKIKCFLETNILCYFPFFKKIENVQKKDIRNILQSYLLELWNEDWENIMTDFEESGHLTFQEYVSSLENAEELRSISDYYESGKKGLMEIITGSVAHLFQNLLYREEWEEIVEDEYRNGKITFRYLLRIFWKTSHKLSQLPHDAYFKEWLDFSEHHHPIWNCFQPYIEEILSELMIPQRLFNQFNSVGSSRVSVQRLYNVDSFNDSFGQTLSKYFTARLTYEKDGYIVNTFTNKWIRTFEIGDHITIKNVEGGLGIVTYLHTNEEDINGHLLADEGYGITQLFSILLGIETCILTKDSSAFTTVVIEEPEIHLHPRYQSLLAEMFMDAYKNYNIHFIIETHSEYLIRKLQTLIAKTECELNNDDVAIHYISKEASQKVKRIGIKDDGRLETPFGAGFFDEADNLAMELLTIKWM